MTSQLNVDTIVDKAGSGGTNVKIANTSVAVAEGGSGTTNTVQGLIKSWVNFEQDGTHASRDSFNISSLTDEAVGRTHPISFTNNMGSGNYSGSMYSNAYIQANLDHNGFNNHYAGGFGSRTTSGHSIVSYGAAGVDADNVQVASWGDLA